MSYEKMFQYWKKELGLENWTIKVKLDKDLGSFGTFEADTVHKCAVITVLPDGSKQDEFVIPYDIEKTIVHELLHIKLSLVEASMDEVTYRIYHQELDSLAVALIRVRKSEGGYTK